MDDNIVVADANAHQQQGQEQDVLQEEEQESSNFNLVLQKLARNEYVSFNLGQIMGQGEGMLRPLEERLTLPQIRAVSAALMTSTLVEEFHLDFRSCSVQAFVPFVAYIRTSPRLKQVSVRYSCRLIYGSAGDPEEVQQGYMAYMASIFQAVQDNPFIRKFGVYLPGTRSHLNTSLLCDAIYNLLASDNNNNPQPSSSSSALQEFHITAPDPLTDEFALAIAAGLSRNSGILKKLKLGFSNGPLDLLLPGLPASSVESFSLQYLGAHSIVETNILPAVAKMLFYTPSLKELVLSYLSYSENGDDDEQPDLGKIFLDLRHPTCSGLKKLQMEWISLSADNETNSFGVAPMLTVNRNLSILTLAHIRFTALGAVRVLWNVVGLKEVIIKSPVRHATGDAFLEDWAEFIRRNTGLDKLTLECCIFDDDDDDDHAFLMGVLDGARGHGSLKKITFNISGSPFPAVGSSVGSIGVRLGQVLQETPSITELCFEQLDLAPGFVIPLTAALSNNSSLTTLHFSCCYMEASSINAILASLLVNQTLENLSIEYVVAEDSHEAVGQAFLSSGIFQINKTLVKVAISKCDLRGDRVSQLLRENYTLKTLLLDRTLIDNESMISLGRTLEFPHAVMQDIGLPENSIVFQDHVNVQEGTRAFLRSLARMPTIHTVRFGFTMKDADEDMRRLLMRAVQENKKLHHFHDYVGYWEHRHRGPFVSQIEYYLKLNRFGRRVLDTPNIIPSLWPRILSPMTVKPEDADALFFFVREFFSRHQDEPASHQSQLQQSRPARQRARSA